MDRLDLLCVVLMSVHLCVRAENPRDCDIYKDCVECKAFSRGAFGVMECLWHCDIATYLPVDDLDFQEELKNLPLCQYKDVDNCVFAYRMGKETEYGPDLYIRQELDCPVFEPTYPPVVAIDVTLEPMTSTTTLPTVTKEHKNEENTENNQVTKGHKNEENNHVTKGYKNEENNHATKGYKSEEDKENIQSDSGVIVDTQSVAGKDSNVGSENAKNNQNKSASLRTASFLVLTICFMMILSKYL